MTDAFQTAFDQLSALGDQVSLIEGGQYGEDTFRINSGDLANYWNPQQGLFGVHKVITDILDENGLRCEWENSEVLNVYEN